MENKSQEWAGCYLSIRLFTYSYFSAITLFAKSQASTAGHRVGLQHVLHRHRLHNDERKNVELSVTNWLKCTQNTQICMQKPD
jgi:hypothetical protein